MGKLGYFLFFHLVTLLTIEELSSTRNLLSSNDVRSYFQTHQIADKNKLSIMIAEVHKTVKSRKR